MADWNKRFIDLAKHIAEWSKDKSTKVGAVIATKDNVIVSIGYNGFARGLDDNKPERHERPAKYMFTEHAESNAILNATRTGATLKGCTIYLPWFTCSSCARAIIQVGIDTIVCKKPDISDPRWGEHFKIALEMFQETGVKIIYHED